MKNIIITTTNSIENCPVIEYLDFVCANVVLGVNIFSDIAASFTDIFGGKSNSYQNKLELIQKDVIKQLKDKSIYLGANAILSCRIDFDEISGGGKSMFMVSASGTACIIDLSNLSSSQKKLNTQEIPINEYYKELNREYIVTHFSEVSYIKEDWVEFLVENPQDELAEAAVKKYIDSTGFEDELNKILKIASRINRDKLINAAYANLEKNQSIVSKFIDNLDLFCPSKILDLCKSGKHKIALMLIRTDALEYTLNDISLMKEILEYFKSLPDTGEISTVKTGLFGKENERYICEDGHKSSISSKFCEHENCNKNIKGLNSYEATGIKKLTDRVRILEKLTFTKK